MLHPKRTGKVNKKVLIILVASVIVLGVGALVARHVRRQIIARSGLEEGLAAFERADWTAAWKGLRNYLMIHPEDPEILRKYAQAHLSVEPLQRANVGAATNAYRRLMNVTPKDRSVYEELARLYTHIGDFGELAYIARKRLQVSKDDVQAKLWLCRALLAQDKGQESLEQLSGVLAAIESARGAGPDDPQHAEAFFLRAALAAGGEGSHETVAAVRAWLGGRDSGRPLTPAEVHRWTALGKWLDRTEGRLTQRRKEVLRAAAALMWLDRAHHRYPASAEVLVRRANFCRLASGAIGGEVPGLSGQQMLAAARADLAAAGALEPADPRVRVRWSGPRRAFAGSLFGEWLALGELSKAAHELAAFARLAEGAAARREYFVDPADARMTEFLAAAELALRRGVAVRQALKRADETLGTLMDRRHRIAVLPHAIRLCLAADRIHDGEPDGKPVKGARSRLEEYLDLLKVTQTVPDSPEELPLLRARLAVAEKRPYRVIELLEPLAGRDVSDSLVLILLADAYRQTGRGRLAAQTYALLQPSGADLTAQQKRQVAAVSMELARARIKQGDWTGAEAAARRAEQMLAAGDDASALPAKLLRIEAGIGLAQRNRPKRPSQPGPLTGLSNELTQLRTSHPRHVAIRVLQANVALCRGDVQAAENVLQNAIEQCDPNLPAMLHLARVCAATRRLAKAIEWCSKACQRHPEAATAWLGLSDCHRAKALAEAPRTGERFAEARRTLRSALGRVTDRDGRRRLVHVLALLEVLDGRRSDAIDRLKALAAKDKQDIRTRSLLLGLLDLRNDAAEAQRLVDQVHEIEGNGGAVWRWNQAVLWHLGPDRLAKRQDILDQLRRCLEADPGWAAPALMLGRLHERLGDAKEAEAVYRRTLSADPSAVAVVDRLVGLLKREKRLSDAGRVLDDFRASRRALAIRRFDLAAGQGDYDRAIGELQELMQHEREYALSRKDVGARVALGRLVYLRRRDANEAMKHLRDAEAAAQDIGPEGKAAWAVRVADVKAWILGEEGRLPEARGVLDALVSREEQRTRHDKSAKRDKLFAAYHLRAAHLESVGRRKEAEAMSLSRRGEAAAAKAARMESTAHFEAAERDYRRLGGIEAADGTDSLLLARFYVRRQRTDEAVDVLAKGTKKHPDSGALKRALLRLLLERGRSTDHKQALAVLRDLERRAARDANSLPVDPTVLPGDLAALPDDADLLYVRAVLELRKRQPQSTRTAERLLRRVIQIEPVAVRAHLALIGIAVEGRRYEEARNLAVSALGKRPTDDRLLLARADAERLLGNFAMAESLVHVVLKDDPDNADALGLLADVAVGQRDAGVLEEARRLVEQAVRSDPDSVQLQLARVRVLVASERQAEALAKLEAFCRTQSDRRALPALLAAAELCRLQGRPAEAGRHIERAETLSPGSPAVMRERIVWLGAQGRHDDVVKLMADYRAVEQQHPEVIATAAAVLASAEGARFRGQAKALYGHLKATKPGMTEGYSGLAWLAYQDGDVDTAERLYRQVLEINPNDPRVLNDLAWILAIHRRKYKEALKLADRGVSIDPSNRHLRDTRGVILSRLSGRLQDARRDFETCVELTADGTPERAKSLLQLGRACFKLKDAEAARRHLEAAQTIDDSKHVFDDTRRADLRRLLARCKG